MSLEGVTAYLIKSGSRVTSRLDLRDNRKVITNYRNLGIIHILIDLIVSLGYLPDVLQEPPSRVVPRKASSCGLGPPWGHNPCGLPWVSGVIPPTTRLLQKNEKFRWTPECEAAFHTLRTLLTIAPVLAQPDIEKPFDLFCDASGIALGCVLMQEGRVIAYASQQLRNMKSTTLHMI